MDKSHNPLSRWAAYQNRLFFFFCGIKGFFTLKCKVIPILTWCLRITLNSKGGSFFKKLKLPLKLPFNGTFCAKSGFKPWLKTMFCFCVSGSSVGSSVAAVLQWPCSGAISMLRCPGAAGGSRPRRPELRPQQCPQPPSLCQVRYMKHNQLRSYLSDGIVPVNAVWWTFQLCSIWNWEVKSYHLFRFLLIENKSAKVD